MSSINKEQIYCSLDIETSGFDPKTSELLEIGFVFFTVDKKTSAKKNSATKDKQQNKKNAIDSNGNILQEVEFKILEEYTQVFKPNNPVSANILGLTGISQDELDNAPSFETHRDFIQNKLKDATILGHNVNFDLKFLTGIGLEFCGEVIDTLEIVQFILPTHPSYNLENLAHLFNIHHKDAHRALSDCKASVELLQKMLQVYAGLSSQIKNQIYNLLENHKIPWRHLLELPFSPSKSPETLKNKTAKTDFVYPDFDFKTKTIFNFPLGQNFLPSLLESIRSKNQKFLVVVPLAQQAMALWQENLGQAIFLPEQEFDQKTFEAYLKKPDLTSQQAKFLVKILVWQELNWQNKTILDLNLSFAGGQFKNLITGRKAFELTKPEILICDVENFVYLSSLQYYKDREVLILGLNEFESLVSKGISSQISWGSINYVLKSYYQLETDTGEIIYKQPVEELLNASDLFFGLVSALLQTSPATFQYIKLNEDFCQTENYFKIKSSAENFILKIQQANKIFNSKELEKIAQNLYNLFFNQTDTNTVKWLELAEKRCIFFSSPLKINALVEEILKSFKNTAFVDALAQTKLIDFFKNRLGLSDFNINKIVGKVKEQNLQQKDLFGKISKTLKEKILPNKKSHINFYYYAQNLPDTELIRILKSDMLPAAVLFGANSQIKNFYEQYFKQLQTFSYLQAQSVNGSSNRLIRNFHIHQNALLLATDKFILKHISGINSGLIQNLSVKTLILTHLPFEQFTHPYQEALAAEYNNAFTDFSLPKAVFNLNLLIKFFLTSNLKEIYLYDAKLSKPYAKDFIDYIAQIPDIIIKS